MKNLVSQPRRMRQMRCADAISVAVAAPARAEAPDVLAGSDTCFPRALPLTSPPPPRCQQPGSTALLPTHFPSIWGHSRGAAGPLSPPPSFSPSPSALPRPFCSPARPPPLPPPSHPSSTDCAAAREVGGGMPRPIRCRQSFRRRVKLLRCCGAMQGQVCDLQGRTQELVLHNTEPLDRI